MPRCKDAVDLSREVPVFLLDSCNSFGCRHRSRPNSSFCRHPLHQLSPSPSLLIDLDLLHYVSFLPFLLHLCRKSNWIADRMKKLIKPKGGGGREGRALFYAAGSIENLADSADYPPDTQTAAGSDPRSAPVSPSPLRHATSLGDSDQAGGLCGLPLRSGLGGRRKLGSHRKLGSQSFSPGDQTTSPLQRLQSADRVIWEGQSSPTDTPMTSANNSQENVMEEGGRGEEDKAVSGDNIEGHLNSDPCCQSSKDKPAN
ncbi:unnamed protein product [Oncorhynchus mykiss]|uniref:Uncharacterized protein n=1 Tax=Oncorhynchus mykiss TaxID=8022 RepID=A0A060YSR2_ONCMY|nr:unnamed protein product [Oncorhynchus mykiss]